MPDYIDYPEDLQPYMSAFSDDVTALMIELEAGDIEPAAWRDQFANLLAAYIAVAWFVGRPHGSVTDALEGEALAWVQGWLADQLDYLNNWLGSIQANYSAGGTYVPGWSYRGQMYVTSMVAPFWFSETEGLPIPALPGDGSSQCGQNCNCAIFIQWQDRDKGNAEIFWRLNQRRQSSENCQTCKERADKWNPLEVRNWKLVVPAKR